MASGSKSTLSQSSILTLNALNDIELEFDEGPKARDLEHAAFIAKSDYLLPQMSTKIDFIEFKGMLIAIANGRKALTDLLFRKTEKGYDTLRLSMQTHSKLESMVAAALQSQ